MTDLDQVVRAALAGVAGLTTVVGTRLYAAARLPAGYTVADGPCLLFSRRGGSLDYSQAMLRPSFQFLGYGETETAARQVERALYDAAKTLTSATIKGFKLEAIPALLTEPETGWPYTLSFYQVHVINP